MIVDLDLRNDSAAHEFVKIVPVMVEFAQFSGVIETNEGLVTYQPGDAIMTGIEGEQWPVSHGEFDKIYEPVNRDCEGKPGLYRKRHAATIWAKKMPVAFEVEVRPGGSLLKGRAGDWLAQYAPGQFGVVTASIFEKTYKEVA